MSGTELATAYVSIVPSAQGIKGNLERELNLDAAAKTAGESAGKSLSKSLITGATAAAAGVAIGSFFKAAFSEAQESQKVGAQTTAVLKSTGEAANISADQIGNLATALSKKAGIDDEVIQSGENVLLTFTKVRNEAGKGNDIFTQGTKIALDMSVALGSDLKSANIQLGKALNDPIKGITALQRVGVTFTQQQKDQIATLVASGNVLGAQKVILKELTTEFSGSAAAQATSADKAGVAIKNLEESVGIALMPAFNTAAEAISFFTNALNDLPAPVRSVVVDVGLLGAGILAAAVVASKFGGAFSLIASGAQVAGEALAGATSILEGFTAAEIASTVGVTAGIAAIGALGFILGSTDGPYERIASAAEKWGKATVNAAKSSDDELKALQITSGALETRIGTLKAEQTKLSDAISAGQPGAQGYKDKLNEVSEALTVAQQRHKALTPEIERLKGQQEAARIEVAASKSALDAYSTALASGATQEQALAAAGDKGREAIQNLQNVLLAAAGGAVGYAQSQANLTKAQDDYNTAVATFGPNSAEAQAAQLALNQAQLANVQAAQSADAAQQTLTQSLVDGSTTYKEQIGLLLQQLQLHPENAAGIQLEINKLNDAKTAADAIPGSKSITIAVNDQASAVLDNIGRIARGLPNVTIDAFAHAFDDTRAAGGPVWPDSTFLVGEHGPELFTPKSAGTIIPHAQSAALLQSAAMPLSGGGGVVFNIDKVGTSEVIPDLDYFARTRMAGV